MSTLKTINLQHPSSANNNIVLDSAGNANVANNLVVTGAMTVQGRVNIGSAPSAGIQVYAGSTPNTLDSYVVLTDATIGSNTTSSATAFTSNPSTVAASFTISSLNHFLATQGTIGAGSAVTNQRGFYAFNNLTGATNNYGFYSDIAFAANRWNFYASGTAYNFFQGGSGFGNGPLAYTQIRMGGTAPSSSALSYSLYADQTAPSTTTSEFASFYSTPSTAAASFTLGTLFHFIAIQGTKGAGSTITNQFGFYVGNNLVDATNNYGFYSNIPFGSNRWNLFINGTASNYIAGNVGIGITAPTSNLHVVGNANVSTNLRVGGNVSFDNIDSVRIFEPAANTLTIHTASTERVRVDSTGNVGIGTASPTYKLDVAGTGHITGVVTLDTALGVASGGTGVNTLTGIVKGSGTSAFSAAVRGTDYSLLSANSAVASTSGQVIDFLNIPSGVKVITVMLNAVSSNGVSNLLVQIGDSGGIENSGYAGASTNFTNGTLGMQNFGGAGFTVFDITAAGAVHHGHFTLTNISGNIWVCSGIISRSDTTRATILSGTKTLSATLDRVRVTTNTGFDVFDAGSINIFYEY